MEITLSYKESDSTTYEVETQNDHMLKFHHLDENALNYLLKSINGSYSVKIANSISELNNIDEEISEKITKKNSHVLLFPMVIPIPQKKKKSKKVRKKSSSVDSTSSSFETMVSTPNHPLKVLLVEASPSLKNLLQTWYYY